ncbi:MAG: PHP domain-containing protein [Firmicutes bacterium]|nr:PHP domain-containing protein [Bacillota bacterium]
MVDLHTHTNNSDGMLSTRELLELANKSGISVLSITDHNSVQAYKELGDVYNGKLVTGVELSAFVGKQFVDVLGYGIDVAKVEKEIKNYTLLKTTPISKQVTEDVLKKLGIDAKLELSDVTPNGYTHIAVVKKYGEQMIKVDPSLSPLNSSQFLRTNMVNPKSKWFVDLSHVYPELSKAVDIIHRCGGLAFLAHPYHYPDVDYVLNYAKDFVDGIECFHTTADKEKREYLVNFCKTNNLLVTGGSDFHLPNVQRLGCPYTQGFAGWIKNLRINNNRLLTQAKNPPKH